jgi:XapX domain-containing protein
MTAVLQALALGIIVGAIFAVFRQPVPAPSTLAGIAGVVGLFAGWAATATLVGRG